MPNSSYERPNFFSGRLLTVEDFELEQNYSIEKRRLHNRALHGFGLVSGLSISSESNSLIISPGMAIDCEGNEIVVEQPQTFSASSQPGHAAFVSIKFKEDFIKPVSTQKGAQPSTIKDSFELIVTQNNCNARHRHAGGRWLACGQAHPLTLARLRQTPSGWRVDRSYRPPAVK